MELALIIILFLVGIVLIVKGGDFFVDASTWIAEVSGIPKLIIGATLVSLATTLPEIIVSITAATKGKVDMSVGNAVGSVTANIGLIMAISIICIPAVIKRSDYLAKSALMLAAAGMIVMCGLSGEVGTVFSIALLAIFIMFLWENVASAKSSAKESQENEDHRGWGDVSKKEIGINVAKFILGAAGIVIGADLLVDNGSALARLMGISERVIGVTFIAIGTSLPELITTLTAVSKKQSSLSVGNILGANIIDLTLILPICNLVSGKALPIAATSGKIDLPACLIVGCIALIPTLVTSKFQRWQGFALLIVYAVYMFLTCSAAVA